MIGPGQAPIFALPAFASQLKAIADGEQTRKLMVGNLSARRDFVHVDDAVEGFRVLLDRGRPGHIYNLGTGLAHSVQEALDELMRVSGVNARIEVDPQRFRQEDRRDAQGVESEE